METTVITNSDLRVRVEDFYARQMQALDEGRYEQFADSFAPEGVFSHHPASPPAVGRAAIVNEILAHRARSADTPTQTRHWFNHIVLDQRPDGLIAATVYVLIVNTRPGNSAELGSSCVMHDVLAVGDTDIHTAERKVTYDRLR
jgi:actinorhodin biosynthesis protein ActVIA